MERAKFPKFEKKQSGATKEGEQDGEIGTAAGGDVDVMASRCKPFAELGI